MHQKSPGYWAVVASVAAAVLLSCLWVLPALAQAPVAQGPEVQVNSYTTGNQALPSVAVEANGDFVVVWDSYASPGTDADRSIQGQRYASSGTPIGSEFQVNSYTTNTQYYPSVATALNGDFVVVWASYGSSGTDTSGASIQAQRYASNGTLSGSQFQVNTYTPDNQKRPFVAAAANGDFVVVWQSNGSAGTDSNFESIQGQRYASSGTKIDGEFQVNTYTPGAQERPSVAAAANGDFVVVWASPGSPGTDSDPGSIQGQRYASSGTKIGSQFQVNTYTPGDQDYPSVAAANNGDFVVVWQSNGSAGTDTSYESIQGQRYASSGTKIDGEFQVNSYTTNSQSDPSVAAEANGDFIVVWKSDGSAGSDSDETSIQGQRYASSGTPIGGEFQVNSYTTMFQRYPGVAASPIGDFVVVWQSDGSSGTDASGFSIQSQRFASIAVGDQFQVNSYTTNKQIEPSVASDAEGDFVVVWESLSYGPDGYNPSWSIEGQRYDSNGTKLGMDFRANSTSQAYPSAQPSVASDAKGDFVVVWQGQGTFGTDTSEYSIQGQRYTSSGAMQGSQFQVNTYTSSFQLLPSVSSDANGDFVVVWQSYGSSGTDTGTAGGFSIQGQRFASSGTSLDGQFQVNTYTSSFQAQPSVSSDANGDFVVVWESNGSAGTDRSGSSIQGQRYASSGTPLGGQFQVNSYTTNNQYYPSVATDSYGDFVVVWQSYGSSGTDTGTFSVQGQRFASSGTPLGGQFQVNTYTTAGQYAPSVTSDARGNFVVAWTSYGSFDTDASDSSIQGQRYLPEPGGTLGLAAGVALLLCLRSRARRRTARISNAR